MSVKSGVCNWLKEVDGEQMAKVRQLEVVVYILNTNSISQQHNFSNLFTIQGNQMFFINGCFVKNV